MSKLDKIIEQIADRNYKAQTRYTDMVSACEQTAAAVVELIREQMPKPYPKYGWKYDQEIKKILNDL